MRPRPEEGAWPVDHTADLALRVKADTLPALFEHAALGMTRLALGEASPEEPTSGRQHRQDSENRASPPGREDEVREVAVEGLDYEELLVCWLNELLYLGETEGLWAEGIDSLEIGPARAGTAMSGQEDRAAGAYAPEAGEHPAGCWLRSRFRVRRGAGSPIKAVTYHGLHIDPQAPGGYDQLIVFDT